MLAISTQQLVCCKVTSLLTIVLCGDPALTHMMHRIADILLDPSFQEVQTTFCQKHCHKFEVRSLSDLLEQACAGHQHSAWLVQDADENKLFYTEIFQEYQAVVERSLEQRLSAAIPNFSMDIFIAVSMCALICSG